MVQAGNVIPAEAKVLLEPKRIAEGADRIRADHNFSRQTRRFTL